MKIVMVIDTGRRPEHRKISDIYINALSVENDIYLVDMSSGKPWHVLFAEIVSYKCDLVVAFDCAGFELKTELNMLSYNTLTCRVAHIFTDMKQKASDLSEQFNLSHFVYLPQGTGFEEFAGEHKNMPNVFMAPLTTEQEVADWFETARKDMWL